MKCPEPSAKLSDDDDLCADCMTVIDIIQELINYSRLYNEVCLIFVFWKVLFMVIVLLNYSFKTTRACMQVHVTQVF